MIALFSATIFLSALLLFWIQPLYAKMVLPLLGGSPAVWTTALVFYQSALLAGYAYAHFSVARWGVKKQVLVHLALIVLPAIAIPVTIGRFRAPTGTDDPVVWMLSAMALTVGPPYLAVSATSPLVQRWLAASGHARSNDPYFLYVASNAGSMLALIAFPLILEPMLSVDVQSALWGWGYILLASLLAICGLLTRRAIANRVPSQASKRTHEATDAKPAGARSVPRTEDPTWPRRLRWVFLAAIPCSLMLGVTTYASTDIAVVPMFWIVPLGLYLLSYMLVFAQRPPIPHTLCLRALPWMLASLVFVISVPIGLPSGWSFAGHLLTFFCAAMVCHGELAKDRPSAERLTEFYLLVSLGGAIGGGFNALLAPMLFVTPIEYVVALIALAFALPWGDSARRRTSHAGDVLAPLALLGALVGAMLLERRFGLGSSAQAAMLLLAAGTLACLLWTSKPTRFALALVGVLVAGAWQSQDPRRTLFAGRSFFGTHRVVELPGSGLRHLRHGKVTHGTQNFAEGQEREPQSYYHRSGPFGLLMNSLDLPAGARVGVVGLGVGTLAAYSRPGQRWTFFEIDPVVACIARDPRLFTYLEKARGIVDIELGDGRLGLARAEGKFDLIVLDAFTSDAIPAHLLTREAFELYRSKLRPGGLIAAHITNKHLDLEPLVSAQAEATGLRALVCRDWEIAPTERRLGKAASTWAVLSPAYAPLAALERTGAWIRPRPDPRVALWTDDHSSVLKVLRQL